MKVFESYTGNAILNNALMTIEALGSLDNVSAITTDILLNLYTDKRLPDLNRRLKSYTMLFTKNGPLHNDKTNGEKIYNTLFKTIVSSFENEGDRICEISGLRFSTTFDKLFAHALRTMGFSEKEILNKDLTVNRIWFPLIGGLGSDAQALPQAKFAVQIHPICIPILQFLPLSALLYKGGVLLIDSSNFEFARRFIATNVKEVEKRIQLTSATEAIENVKDFAKGNYLLKAIEILEEKEMADEYSDLNLWSFSNSGTGASCEIERVPNSLIKKLMRLKQNTRISNELKSILNKDEHRFLEDLENNQEWYLLYPNVFGTGKNKGPYEGVSVAFLEAYYQAIESPQRIAYAKYLAYLIEKYKTDSFAKYLGKRDAWKEKDFASDLYAALIKATANGEWDLLHHIEILDDAEEVPVKNNFYSILKLIHFYHYKNAFSSQLPELRNKKTQTHAICEWLIAYIQQDDRYESLKSDLLNSQRYVSVNYTNVFHRASQNESLNLESIFYALYDVNFRSQRMGLNALMRIFFSQPQQTFLDISILQKENGWNVSHNHQKWFEEIRLFVQNYQAYYFDKYENKETGKKPFNKFLRLVNAISTENSNFLVWFYEAIANTNSFLRDSNKDKSDEWSEALLYEPNGEYSLAFAKFAIRFLLLKQHWITMDINSHQILNND